MYIQFRSRLCEPRTLHLNGLAASPHPTVMEEAGSTRRMCSGMDEHGAVEEGGWREDLNGGAYCIV